MSILLIDACVRLQSGTKRLSDCLLRQLNRSTYRGQVRVHPEGYFAAFVPCQAVVLCEDGRRDSGFDYVEALARSFYGIPGVHLIQATDLDNDGADGEQLLQKEMAK